MKNEKILVIYVFEKPEETIPRQIYVRAFKDGAVLSEDHEDMKHIKDIDLKETMRAFPEYKIVFCSLGQIHVIPPLVSLKNKYAAVPICIKDKEIRTALISYKLKNDKREFIGTKLLGLHPYFEDPASSHQYVFFDDGYTLDSVITEDPIYDLVTQRKIINNKRVYHDSEFYPAFELKATTDAEALNEYYLVILKK